LGLDGLAADHADDVVVTPVVTKTNNSVIGDIGVNSEEFQR
jgi:hypothetical protein